MKYKILIIIGFIVVTGAVVCWYNKKTSTQETFLRNQTGIINESKSIVNKPVNPLKVVPQEIAFLDSESSKTPLSQKPMGSIDQVIDSGNGWDLKQRLAALDMLGALTQEDIQKLYAFLLGKEPIEGLSAKQIHVLKNDIINLLRTQKLQPEGLTSLLITLFNDKSQDMIMRNYAVQHLYYGHSTDNNNRKSIEQTLWDATQEQGSGIAGTSILALHRMERDQALLVPDEGRTKLLDIAYAIASNNTANLASRISAIQALGKMGEKSALNLAMDIARSENNPVSLRIAAIATIGDLGTQSQNGILNTLSLGKDKRLQVAANSALKKLEL